MADEVSLTIDGVQVTVPKGTLLVEAAKKAQTPEIPVYCYHEKLGPAGLCRVCLVEVVGMPKLQIACFTPATDGMVVNTINDRATDGRRAILEMLLLNHPLDCPICDKGGECTLQDFTVAYGQDSSRMVEAKESKPKAVDLGPTIVLDEERCIVCQRCVRFEEIISREHGLVVKDRGSHDIIATGSDAPYHSDFTGNVTELCPVGALTSKTYRFKSRPWDNHRTTGSCAQCAVGCGISVDVRNDEISRTVSRQDDEVSDGWLCDRGRYAIGFGNDEARVMTPLLRRHGRLEQVAWDDAIGVFADAIRGAKNPRTIAAIGGGRLTNEENYLLAKLVRGLGSPNVEWRTGRQVQAAPGADEGTLVELENADAIVIVGVPPSQTAPVFDLHIRKAVARRKAKLYTVGPFGAGSHVEETRCRNFDDLRGALTIDGGTVAIIWDGQNARTAVDLEKYASEIRNRGCAVRRYIAGDVPNARGAEAMGMHPQFTANYAAAPETGLAMPALLEAAVRGDVSVLAIFGADPVLSYPDGELVRKALANIPFVVVSDLFHTPTTEFASLILPARSAFERSGHFTNLNGDVRPIRASIDPPAGTLTDFDMLVALGDALDVTLPSDAETAAIAINSEAVRYGARSFSFGEAKLAGPALSAFGQSDLRVAVGRSIFAGSSTLAHDTRVAVLRTPPTATVNRETAKNLGLIAGAVIDIKAENRALVNLTVRIDGQMETGVVAVVDHLIEAPANMLRDGEPIRIENVRGERPLVGAASAQ